MKGLGLNPPVEELERITEFFAVPPFDAQASDDLDLSDPDFALWVDQNVSEHKQPGYAIATISLKPRGGIPGDATSAQIDLMADLGEQYSFDELRVTHSQNIVLPHVKKSDLYALWQKLDEAGLAPANLDLITDSIACPGFDYCSLANARSIPLAHKITGPGFTEDGVIDAIETVTDLYLAQREEGERFIDTYRRVGMEKFKEAIYG